MQSSQSQPLQSLIMKRARVLSMDRIIVRVILFLFERKLAHDGCSRMPHHLLASQELPLCYLFVKRGRIKIDFIALLSSLGELLGLRSTHGHAVGWLMCGRLSYMTAENLSR